MNQLAVLGAALGAGWAVLCFLPAFESKPLASACVVVSTSALLGVAVLVAAEVGRCSAGVLLGVAGLMSPLSSLGGWDVGVLPAVRGLSESALWVVLAAAVLLYQHPRVEVREVCYLSWLFLHLIGGQLVLMAIGDPRWLGSPARAWSPLVAIERTEFELVVTALAVLYPVDALVFIALAAWRQRRVGALDRYSLSPVLIGVAAAAFTAGVVWTVYNRTTIAIPLALLPVPAAFVYGARRLTRLRMAVAEAIDGLAEGPSGLRDALRRVLRDDTLQVRFWSPETGCWVDENGAPHLSAMGTGRWRVPVAARDSRVRAEIDTVIVSPHARRGVEAAVRVAGWEIENAGLRAVLKVQVEASRRARDEATEAAGRERRDLQRDLHDHAQSRLHGLVLLLARARRASADTRLTSMLEEASREAKGAIEELRELSHGHRPSTLARGGLDSALTEVAARLEVPVEVRVSVGRYDREIEDAVYHLVCEALTNIGKHSGAQQAWVVVEAGGGVLRATVSDDGVGGADTTGGGIRGMRERVVDVGGTFQFRTIRGRGTRVSALVPV